MKILRKDETHGTDPDGGAVWEDARVDCVVQGAATAAWLVVFAMARLLLESHL